MTRRTETPQDPTPQPEEATMTSTATLDAHLHRRDLEPAETETPGAGMVSYLDAGAGLYLVWTNAPRRLGMLNRPDLIHVISADGRRTLAEVPTEARTITEAEAEILRAIKDPAKTYGARAGLWEAGDTAEDQPHAVWFTDAAGRRRPMAQVYPDRPTAEAVARDMNTHHGPDTAAYAAPAGSPEPDPTRPANVREAVRQSHADSVADAADYAGRTWPGTETRARAERALAEAQAQPISQDPAALRRYAERAEAQGYPRAAEVLREKAAAATHPADVGMPAAVAAGARIINAEEVAEREADRLRDTLGVLAEDYAEAAGSPAAIAARHPETDRSQRAAYARAMLRLAEAEAHKGAAAYRRDELAGESPHETYRRSGTDGAEYHERHATRAALQAAERMAEAGLLMFDTAEAERIETAGADRAHLDAILYLHRDRAPEAPAWSTANTTPERPLDPGTFC